MASSHDTVIVGAGLAGLTCARALCDTGRDVVLLEASDGPGGRVRTDVVEGFRLDRGFQILLTAYPEVQAQLDCDALDLQPFAPGAVVHLGGDGDERSGGRAGFVTVGDPLRRPQDLFSTLAAPVGTFADKLRVLPLALGVRRGDAADLLRAPDMTTAEALERAGFSERMVERFWRPLLAGIQLDPDLEVSARRFRIILRMLATGDAAVPAAGMQAIPDQLAAALPDGVLRTGVAVATVRPGVVTTTDGEELRARSVVVATDGPTATRLVDLTPVRSRQVACVYFAADEPPRRGAAILLDGDGTGPALNVAVMSETARSYAPAGRALVACAVPGPQADRADLDDAVRAQMRGWFGSAVDGWRHLRTYRIAHGQPDQPPPLHPKQRQRLGDGVYVCGDHRDTASIQGAMYSGRRCAEAVLADSR